jgi:hypothetical protein
MRILTIAAGVLCMAFLCGGCGPREQKSAVNFSHLEHLTEIVDVGGQHVGIVHIYANYPDYAWVDAKESGPEGIACVDDAARAAVLYLRDYELNRNQKSLDHARVLLDFVLTMQAPDGEFWNFIFADHSINRDGKTSFKSFGWWASRGVWCLGLGARLFEGLDPSYSSRLAAAVERTLPHIETLLKKYGQTEHESGFTSPTWLLYGSGADATSELLMGLVEYYKCRPSPALRDAITRLAYGLILMQEGDVTRAPYGLHRSWSTLWHLWGNGQTQALASAGRVLGDSAMVASARVEADGFYPRLITSGLLKEMDLRPPGTRKEYEQIAYGIRPMTVGLLRLYDATGNPDYLRMAGLAASWLFGNNVLGVSVYDSTTGRCFDGIRSMTELNRNSGAESTIEALMTLVELEAYPQAVTYSRYRRDSADSVHAVFSSPEGSRITLELQSRGRGFAFK